MVLLQTVMQSIMQILIIALVCISNMIYAQNLVPNSSFEDVNICTEYHAPCSPSAWFFVRGPFTQGYAAIDDVPSPTGNKHLNIKVLSRQYQDRQYWQCKLLCSLREGMKYKISLKIASPYVDPNLNDIGFYFTDSLFFSLGDTILQPKYFITFVHAKIRKLKNNWFELNSEFISTDHKQFLTIGNFSAENDSMVLNKRKIPDRFISLLIDDVTIVPEDKSLCTDYLAIKDSIYSIHKRHSFLKVPQPDTAIAISPVINKIDTFVINDIQFDVDSYKLSDQGSLDYLKDHLKSMMVKEIKIYGYADNSGKASYNLELSFKRASEIARLIILKFGISESIIKTEGKGISTEYIDQKKNRRVEIYIYHD